MTIELRFVREAGLCSDAIAWFGGDLGFSHVGAVVRGPDRPWWWPRNLSYCGSPGYELGARLSPDRSLTGRPGVQLRPLDYVRFVREECVSIPATPDQEHDFWSAWSRQLGCPYSIRTILGFVFDREFRDRGHWDCSTGCAWSLVEGGVFPASLRRVLQQISPNTLYAMSLVRAQ